ncbi:MAG: alpha/beta hydrolase [Deltaproteobacteria bacterium]|nr:alpha/beta hydrolase [Deltaproteobacteria bacterium]
MAAPSFHPFRSEKAQQRYLERYQLRAAAWPVPSIERMVETSFGRTCVRISGPEGAPPLVMLPGIGSPGLSFTRNVQALSEHFRTIAVDNIHDHGLSVETCPVTSADDFTTWLDELFTALKLGDVVNLLGLSYGGWISAHYALRFPQRVGRVVLLAPAGTVAPIPWGFIWRAILCLIPARALMRNLMNWVRTTENPDTASAQVLDDMADDAFLAQRSFALRRMVPPIPLSDEQWNAYSARTLFLVGDREVIFPAKEGVAKLAALAPKIESAIMAGAGHDFFVSRADEVNRRVLEFFAKS